MANEAWKSFELRMSKYFPNGRRRGPDTRSHLGGGNSDIICDGWSPECKLLSRPNFATVQSAVAQAIRNCEPEKVPIAIIKKKGGRDLDSIVAMDLRTFREWFLPPSLRDSVEDLPDS